MMLAGLLIAVCIPWSAMADSGCRTLYTSSNPNISLTQKISLDLIHGLWANETKVNGNKTLSRTLMQFDAKGSMSWFQINASGEQHFSNYAWLVVLLEEEPILVLKNIETKQESYYFLKHTCLGIELKNEHLNELINLKHHPRSDTKKVNSIRQQLVGNWKNSFYPFEIVTAGTDNTYQKPVEGAFFQYEFKADGTFTRSFGGTKKNIREAGKWEISKDGSFVFFHTFSKGIKQTSIAKIKHLQLDELVLEQSLCSKKAAFKTGLKQFYFNK